MEEQGTDKEKEAAAGTVKSATLDNSVTTEQPQRKPDEQQPEDDQQKPAATEGQDEREPSAAPFTWITVIFFVIMIVGMLLLLYYLYNVFGESFQCASHVLSLSLFQSGSSLSCLPLVLPVRPTTVCRHLSPSSPAVLLRSLFP